MLIKCTECGKEISSQASSCPHCGNPAGGNVPKCPTCGSTQVEKISLGNKVGAAALFGVFSVGHLSKTLKCKKCGCKW